MVDFVKCPERPVYPHQPLADQALLGLGRRLQADGYRFITPTPLTHQRVNNRPNNPRNEDLRGVFGWSRPFEANLFKANDLAMLEEAGIVQRCAGLYRSTVRWSSLGPLLLAHSAFPTTEADAVFFGPDSYRFASLIEEHLLQHFTPVHRAVDIGCGAGVGALVVARTRRDAEVLALDINPRALRLCAVNAELAEATNVSVYHSDVLSSVEGRFDLILANPPYMNDVQQRAYRHGGGALGEHLSLRILEESLPRLQVHGTLLLYTGVAMVAGSDPFLAAAQRLLTDANFAWTYRELDPDVFGEELEKPGYEQVERIAVVALTVSRLR
ncbi:class I SAM-dependent methyltransferase [Pseudomonas sp. V1]|jgi:methylase of polypeptide subunit release factors|uniref:methyltransferase n=1 Tax=Pseudomonas arcuscaelestis TaxID=2710591 RepID=UPI00193FF147|nr:class I SAM-dependent methyltransferase [Pseudomonas arcuscaelestis]MBM3104043.1 class I SAM-dependent methyltransferase [Pseudomonas arcuscaelestis]